jgi:hypothetical protein
MRKSDNILSPDEAGLQTAAIFRGGREPQLRPVSDDEQGLWAFRIIPSTTFSRIFPAKPLNSGLPGIGEKQSRNGNDLRCCPDWHSSLAAGRERSFMSGTFQTQPQKAKSAKFLVTQA